MGRAHFLVRAFGNPTGHLITVYGYLSLSKLDVAQADGTALHPLSLARSHLIIVVGN